MPQDWFAKYSQPVTPPPTPTKDWFSKYNTTTPTVTAQPEQPGMFKRAYDWAMKPLYTGIGDRIRSGAQWASDPNNADKFAASLGAYNPLLGLAAKNPYIRGGMIGMGEGVGDVVDSLTSPFSLATAGLGGAEYAAGKAGLGATSRLLGWGTKLASAPVAIHGGAEVIRPDATMGERLMGVGEFAGGMAGALHTPGYINIEKPAAVTAATAAATATPPPATPPTGNIASAMAAEAAAKAAEKPAPIVKPVKTAKVKKTTIQDPVTGELKEVAQPITQPTTAPPAPSKPAIAPPTESAPVTPVHQVGETVTVHATGIPQAGQVTAVLPNGDYVVSVGGKANRFAPEVIGPASDMPTVDPIVARRQVEPVFEEAAPEPERPKVVKFPAKNKLAPTPEPVVPEPVVAAPTIEPELPKVEPVVEQPKPKKAKKVVVEDDDLEAPLPPTKEPTPEEKLALKKERFASEARAKYPGADFTDEYKTANPTVADQFDYISGSRENIVQVELKNGTKVFIDRSNLKGLTPGESAKPVVPPPIRSPLPPVVEAPKVEPAAPPVVEAAPLPPVEAPKPSLKDKMKAAQERAARAKAASEAKPLPAVDTSVVSGVTALPPVEPVATTPKVETPKVLKLDPNQDRAIRAFEASAKNYGNLSPEQQAKHTDIWNSLDRDNDIFTYDKAGEGKLVTINEAVKANKVIYDSEGTGINPNTGNPVEQTKKMPRPPKKEAKAKEPKVAKAKPVKETTPTVKVDTSVVPEGIDANNPAYKKAKAELFARYMEDDSIDLPGEMKKLNEKFNVKEETLPDVEEPTNKPSDFPTHGALALDPDYLPEPVVESPKTVETTTTEQPKTPKATGNVTPFPQKQQAGATSATESTAKPSKKKGKGGGGEGNEPPKKKAPALAKIVGTVKDTFWGKAKYKKFMENNPRFKEIMDKLIKARSTQKIIAEDVYNKFKQYESVGPQGLVKLQEEMNQGLHPEVRKFFDDLHDTLTKAGIEVDYKKGYLPQEWADSPAEVAAAIKSLGKNKAMSKTASFQIKSRFRDYAHGIEKGLTPQSGLIELMQNYAKKANKLMADRAAIDALYKEGFIHKRKITPEGHELLDPNLSTYGRYKDRPTLKAHPAIKEVLENYLKDNSDTLYSDVANKSGKMANIMMSSGLFKGRPLLTARGFSIANPFGGRAFQEGGFKRYWQAIKYGLNPKKAAAEMLTENAERQWAGRNHGWNENTSEVTRKPESFFESEDGNPFTGMQRWKNPINKLTKWQYESFEKPLSEQMMPKLKWEAWKDTYNEGIKKGMTDKEAGARATKWADKFYSGENLDLLYNSKEFNTSLRNMFLSPRWMKTNLNIGMDVARVFNPQSDMTKLDRAKNLKVLGKVFATYVGANLLQKAATGKFMVENEPGHKFEFEMGTDANGKPRRMKVFSGSADWLEVGGETAGAAVDLARGNEIASPAAEVSRFLGNRLSIPLATAASIYSGEDYKGRPNIFSTVGQYGQPVPTSEKLANTAGQLVSFGPPIISNPLNYALGRSGLEESIARVGELPLTYGKPKKNPFAYKPVGAPKPPQNKYQSR